MKGQAMMLIIKLITTVDESWTFSVVFSTLFFASSKVMFVTSKLVFLSIL